MTTPTLHPLAADYLARLRQSGRGLPRGRLHELVADIESHLAEAITPEMSDAEALTVLDRLGDPGEIIEAERPQRAAVDDPRGTHEWAAIVLLLLGGFVFGVGWLAGVILLWSSRAWKTWEKWLGTLVIPGGLASVPIVGLVGSSTEGCYSTSGGLQHCTGGPSTLHQILSIVLLFVVVLGPIATAIFLARRAKVPAALR